MNSSLLSNTLLLIIAALLLVLVVQNGAKPSSGPFVSAGIDSGASMLSENQHRNPTVSESAAPMHTSMVFRALKGFPKGCDGKPILEACDSPAAVAVKNEVLKLESEGKNPREIFDYVIGKYGPDVLTDQAKEIRNRRLQAK